MSRDKNESGIVMTKVAEGEDPAEEKKLTPEEQAAQDEQDRKIADYRSLDKEEINALVMDIIENRVFTDRHLGPNADPMMCFMGLALLNEVQCKAIRENPPGMVYAYYKDQAPRSCNGNPIFFSFCLISKEDADVVWKKYDMMRKAMSDIMDDENVDDEKQEGMFDQ